MGKINLQDLFPIYFNMVWGMSFFNTPLFVFSLFTYSILLLQGAQQAPYVTALAVAGE